MPNYIQKLQIENAELRKSISESKEGISAFRVHLASSKFHEDTTIQVRDVLNWLDTISDKLA